MKVIQKANLKRALSLLLTLLLIVVSNGPLFRIQKANAAALSALSDTMSTVTINTLSSHVIRFTTPTGAEESTDTIIITFPSDFAFTSKAISTVAFTHGATTGAETTETLAASPTATAWGAAFSGTANRVFTLTAPTDGVGAATLAATQRVIISYDSTNSTNATSAALYTISISGTFGDTGDISVRLVSNDQVAVSATVAQGLTFSISDNSIGFATLGSSAARYATGDLAGNASETEAHTLIAGTNAGTGYTITVTGATLTHTVTGSYTIVAIGSSNTASSAGTEQFGLRMTATGGSGAVSAPYAAAGFALDTAAFPDAVASSSGSSTDTTYSVRYLANITAATEPGSYTATLTYLATANF